MAVTLLACLRAHHITDGASVSLIGLQGDGRLPDWLAATIALASVAAPYVMVPDHISDFAYCMHLLLALLKSARYRDVVSG